MRLFILDACAFVAVSIVQVNVVEDGSCWVDLIDNVTILLNDGSVGADMTGVTDGKVSRGE